MKAHVHHADNWSTDRPRFVYISWLYAQDYCEYQIHREQVQGVTTDDTPEMIEGSEEHSRLEEEFAAEATLDLTFPEAIEASKEKPISTREIYVQDSRLQICGYIDELVMSDSMCVPEWLYHCRQAQFQEHSMQFCTLF